MAISACNCISGEPAEESHRFAEGIILTSMEVVLAIEMPAPMALIDVDAAQGDGIAHSIKRAASPAHDS